MPDDKIINMPGVSPDKPPEQAAKEMRAHFDRPEFFEFLKACAEYDRMRFEAYKRAGFNDAQALYLTKKESP